MAKTMRQNKDFSQIDLFDPIGREADETEGQAVDGTDEPKLLEFDAVVSNPPYAIHDGGANASAKPIYPEFIELSERITPMYSIIMPARWYTGGKGLDKFRQSMLDSKHIRALHDFPNPTDCFPDINLRGGVCIVVSDKKYDNTSNLVQVVTHQENQCEVAQRSLRTAETEIFIRYTLSQSILNKVLPALKPSGLDAIVSPRRPFGLGSAYSKTPSFHSDTQGLANAVKCYGRGMKTGYIEREDIQSHTNWIDTWKVGVPRANNIGTELSDDNLNAFIMKPMEVCTEAYFVIGANICSKKGIAEALVAYLHTRFVRFMHSIAKASQDATAKTYRFVPLQDFTSDSDIDWSKSVNEIDEQLFDKYGLNESERIFIRERVATML